MLKIFFCICVKIKREGIIKFLRKGDAEITSVFV